MIPKRATPMQIQRTLAQARIFIARGWTKETSRRPCVAQAGDRVDMAYDLWGAVEKACHITHVIPGPILRAIWFTDQWDAMAWNDAPARTWGEVMCRLGASQKEMAVYE